MAELLNRNNVANLEDRVATGLTAWYGMMEETLTEELVGKFVEFVGFENRPGPTKWFLFQEVCRKVEVNRNGTVHINGHEVLNGEVEIG